MQVNFITDPDAADRYEVVDQESGETIENVAWADDEAGRYGVFRLRARTLADKPVADMRLTDSEGQPKIDEREGDIQIVDLAENPMKAMLLALLDDPEVVAVLREKMGMTKFEDDCETAQDKFKNSMRRFRRAALQRTFRKAFLS